MQFLVIARSAFDVQFLVSAGDGVFAHFRFRALVAITPGGGKRIVHRGIDQFHAAPASFRQSGPIAARFVIDLIDQVAPAIHDANERSAIMKLPRKISDHRNVAINLFHARGIGRDHEKALGRNFCATRELETDGVGQFPIGQIHDGWATIEQFNKFKVLMKKTTAINVNMINLELNYYYKLLFIRMQTDCQL